MNKKSFSVCSMLSIAVLMAAISALYAQTSPGDFTNEPDKTMAAAHESFLKGEMNKAAEQINKAAAYVKKEADKVAKDTKEGEKKAGAWIEGAAKWSVTQLKEGTHASIEAVKKVGKDATKGAKAGAGEVDKWFKGIGEGIDDVGRKL